MPWQWGELGLTESGGNRIIKYADAINHGVCHPSVPRNLGYDLTNLFR